MWKCDMCGYTESNEWLMEEHDDMVHDGRKRYREVHEDTIEEVTPAIIPDLTGLSDPTETFDVIPDISDTLSDSGFGSDFGGGDFGGGGASDDL